MLFSSPDYPIFLIAVFFLYALSRRSGWARAALMVLLADIVFVLVSKDPGTLWDPIGGTLLRLAMYGGDVQPEWPIAIGWQWAIGTGLLAGAIALGRYRGAWIASERGQRWIARAIVGMLAVVGAAVAIASETNELAEMTARLSESGHLLVLFVLGIAIGAAQR